MVHHRHHRAALALLVMSVTLNGAHSGEHQKPLAPTDTREPLHLTTDERAHLRAGMRAFLESIAGIVQGLATNQMNVVGESAKKAGTSMVHDVPLSVALKLPPEFVMMSLTTHQKFDALAHDAQDPGTKLSVLKTLDDVLAHCTACHATYLVIGE